MNRKRRTKIFIEFARDEVMTFAKEIQDRYPIELIQEAKEGLVMVKVRETAQNSLFYLGEVLVTEAKVRIENHLGLGLVKGSERDFSFALAIADAAFSASLPEAKEWMDIFLQAEKRGLEMLQEKRSRVAKSKVDFQSMNQ